MYVKGMEKNSECLCMLSSDFRTGEREGREETEGVPLKVNKCWWINKLAKKKKVARTYIEPEENCLYKKHKL